MNLMRIVQPQGLGSILKLEGPTESWMLVHSSMCFFLFLFLPFTSALSSPAHSFFSPFYFILFFEFQSLSSQA